MLKRLYANARTDDAGDQADDEQALAPIQEPEYTMQQAVEISGLSEHTLRYYERVGLLRPVRRDTSSRHRRYSASDISRMETMACLRAVGMPIDQMRRYFDLAPLGASAARERRTMLEAHRHVLETRMRQMESHLAYLERKIAYWQAVEAKDDERSEEISRDIHDRLHADALQHSRHAPPDEDDELSG